MTVGVQAGEKIDALARHYSDQANAGPFLTALRERKITLDEYKRFITKFYPLVVGFNAGLIRSIAKIDELQASAQARELVDEILAADHIRHSRQVQALAARLRTLAREERLPILRAMAARVNVCFLDGREVTALCASTDYTQVTGVRLERDDAPHGQEELWADLVIDASGRGSQAARWLTSLGYGRVEESVVRVDIGYASRVYRHLDQAMLDRKALIIYPTPPYSKRAGYIFPIESGRWIVTLACRLRDYPPADEGGFLDYARSLQVPNLYEAIKGAESLTPIVTHKFPANRWRHYEHMRRFPMILQSSFPSRFR